MSHIIHHPSNIIHLLSHHPSYFRHQTSFRALLLLWWHV